MSWTIRLSFLALFVTAPLVSAEDGKVTLKFHKDVFEEEPGYYTVTAQGYTARISEQGRITSVKLGDLDLFQNGILIGLRDGREKVDEIKQTDDQTLTMRFASRPIVTYQFGTDSFTITIEQKKKVWDFGLFYTVSPRAQLISSKGQSLVRLGLPLLRWQAAYNDAEFVYDDGSVLRMEQSGPGNHINADENGSFKEYSWGRKCLNVGATYKYVFRLTKGAPGTKVLAAPAFAVRQDQLGNIFDAGTPVTFTFELKKEHYQKVVGTIPDILVECLVTDAWAREVTTQEIPIDFQKAEKEAEAARNAKGPGPRPRRGTVLIPAKLDLKRKGWFAVTFRLKDRRSRLVPYPVSTTFSVVTPTEGLHNLPLSARPDTYEFDGFLGLRCNRLAIRLKDVFVQSDNIEKPDLGDAAKGGADLVDEPEDEEDEVDELMEEKKPKPKEKKLVGNWGGLDGQMAHAVEAGKKHGVTSFCLIEEVDWLGKDPKLLEQALYQIVSRYKGKIDCWMLFNEPNLAMSPQNYVNNYLGPLHRAAKKANPKSKVMGPDTCGLNPGWLEAVYKAGGKMDIVEMHPYTGHHRGWDEHGMADAWREVRKVMTAHGDGEREMWSTESGYLWALGRLGPLNHAKHIVRQYPVAESIGIPKDHFFLYYTCFVGYHKMYLIEHDQCLLPGAVAARVQSEQLARTKFVGPVDFGKDKLAFLYRGDTEDVLTAWSYDFPTTARVSFTSKQVRVFEMMGNQVADYSRPDRSKRTVDLPLSGYPIYVRLDREAVVEPELRELGPNYARQEGVKVTASSESEPGIAVRLVDGLWNAGNTGSYEGRLWAAAKSINETKEAWIEIALPKRQAINAVYVYAPSSTCGICGLRSFQLLAFDHAKNDWRTVASVKNSEEAWVFHLDFPAVETDKVKLLIADLNNGFKLEDKTHYTDMKPKVTEVEIYAEKK